jgi:hypothetical protein
MAPNDCSSGESENTLATFVDRTATNSSTRSMASDGKDISCVTTTLPSLMAVMRDRSADTLAAVVMERVNSERNSVSKVTLEKAAILRSAKVTSLATIRSAGGGGGAASITITSANRCTPRTDVLSLTASVLNRSTDPLELGASVRVCIGREVSYQR